MEKCIGCELCAGVCPARCIYVRGADNPIDDPVSPGERYGFVYEINYLRCIHCDLCVEACPTEAITETKLFEFSFTNRADAIYTKDELLVDDEGRARRQPWELWHGGEDDETSAWMRATAPSGQAAFEGKVSWSGELGFGVREPELGQTATERLTPEVDPADHRGHGHSHDHDMGHGDDGTLIPFLFFVAAAAALAGALGVVLARNPVHAALFLVMTLISVAVLFLLQDAELRRGGAGHRLRERDRRAVPVRDHAPRRRPRGVVAGSHPVPAAGRDRARRDPAGRAVLPRRPRVGHGAEDRERRPDRGAVASAATSSGWPACCSPTSSGRSRSPPSSW